MEEQGHGQGGHASPVFYWAIGGILTVITAVEVAIFYPAVVEVSSGSRCGTNECTIECVELVLHGMAVIHNNTTHTLSMETRSTTIGKATMLKL